MLVAELNVAKHIETLTIRVRGLRLATFRMRAAALVFRFGAFVAGCKLDADIN